MSKIKTYKVKNYENWIETGEDGIAVDESSTKDIMKIGEGKVKESLDEILSSFSKGIVSANYSKESTLESGEKVKGSLEGAIYNIICILNYLPENKKQDFVNRVIHDVALGFIKEGHEEKLAPVIEKLTPYMKGQKISLSYLAARITEKDIASDKQKNDIQKKVDYLASKYNETFEKPEKFIETVKAYSELKQKIKNHNEKSLQELREALAKFNDEGYKLSFSMMQDLFCICNNEINRICKEHWDVYNGGEKNKYRAFIDGYVSVIKLMFGVQEDREKQDVARDFISSLSKEDIKNMLDICIERLEYDQRKFDLGFILLLNNNKVTELASHIKLPIKGVIYSYEASIQTKSDPKIAITNFETLLLSDAFTGEFDITDGFIVTYLDDLVNDSQKSDEQKNKLVKKLITEHKIDIEYVLQGTKNVNQGNLKKITEHAKDDLASLREGKRLKMNEKEKKNEQEREKNAKIEAIATEVAEELTKAAIGDKFANKVARDEIKKGIKDSLRRQSEHLFEQLEDKSKRQDMIEKFKETIQKEPIIKEAKTTDGLVRAIVERFINLLAMMFGQESLGQLMKGRITGFDDTKKQTFVDKLKAQEAPQTDKTENVQR